MLAAAPWFAAAQSATPARGGHVDVAGSALWVASSPLGGGAASLTPNTGLAPLTLFTATAKTGRVFGGDLRIGYRFGSGLVLSAVAGVSRVPIVVGISGDTEGAADSAFTGETMLQWTMEGRAEMAIRRLAFLHGRARPHVAASAGVLRQWHEGRVAIEAGRIFQVGGGVAYAFAQRPQALLSRWSLVAEVRAAHVRGGFNWGRAARTSPAFSLGISTTWGR
jgi:hypothetical protein